MNEEAKKADAGFERVVVYNGLLTKEQVDDCKGIQDLMANTGMHKTLPELALLKGYLDEKTVQSVLEIERRKLHVEVAQLHGDKLMEQAKQTEGLTMVIKQKELVSPEAMQECVEVQKSLEEMGVSMRLSEIMIQRGLVDKERLDELLQLELRRAKTARKPAAARETSEEDQICLAALRSSALLSEPQITQALQVQADLLKMAVNIPLSEVIKGKNLADKDKLEEALMSEKRRRRATKGGTGTGAQRGATALGSMALKENLALEHEVAECEQIHSKMQKMGINKSLDEVMVAKGVISNAEAAKLRHLEKALQQEKQRAAAFKKNAMIGAAIAGAAGLVLVIFLATRKPPQAPRTEPQVIIKTVTDDEKWRAEKDKMEKQLASLTASFDKIMKDKADAEKQARDATVGKEESARRAAELAKQTEALEAQIKGTQTRIAGLEEERKYNADKTAIAQMCQKTDEMVRKLAYSDAIELCKATEAKAQTDRAKQEIQTRSTAISSEYKVLQKLVAALNAAGRTPIEIGDHVYWIVSATEEGWTAKEASGGSVTMQWAGTQPRGVYLLCSDLRMGEDELVGLAGFCFARGMLDEAERTLVELYKKNAGKKDMIDGMLATARGIRKPDGGFILYKGEWVTPEDKSFIDRGCRKHQGKWMTQDEIMIAKGFVKNEGRWITKKQKDEIEKRTKALADLRMRTQPKGIINQPGADKNNIPWEKAIEVKTDHYTVLSDIGPEAANEIAFVMELINFNFKKLFNIDEKATTPKATVKVFRNAEEFKGKAAMPESRGYYSSGGPEIVTYYQPGDSFNTTTVLMHEGVHQFVDIATGIQPPIWLNEGLATYYECSRFEGAELKVGLKNKNRLWMIQEAFKAGTHVKLQDFLQVQQSGYTVAHYAEGWALIYFLIHYSNGKYATQFKDFFDRIRKSGEAHEPVKFFMECFSVKDLDAFEDEWKDYIVKLKLDDAADIKGRER